jgi:hypothetical protein
MSGGGAIYHGGFSWAPNPAIGELTLTDEFIELSERRRSAKKPGATIVKVFVPSIASVEITSEQVAKSKVGAVLLFGVLGGLAAKGSRDRGAFLVHLNNGQTGYFSIDGYSEVQLRGKLSPWLNSTRIPLGAPRASVEAPSISVADELLKLASLRDSGVLTGEEFEAQKAKLLG